MYEANEKEREILIGRMRLYYQAVIDLLDAASDKVRKGIPVDFAVATTVCTYQTDLQVIRKSRKKWWRFWR